MSLTTYSAKRHFGRTPEPKARAAPARKRGGPVFVVQKHQASQLHYDFRLEVDGVLKSWAVPKGPSLDPGEKRLARMVEDHPFDYRNFEGTIPEGEYGAGTVMVWDRGTYSVPEAADKVEIERQMHAGLEQGRLSLVLDGEKLRGEFALIRMQGRGGDNWLLMKKKDEFAQRDDILAEDESVISGRDLAGIEQNQKPKRRAAKLKASSLANGTAGRTTAPKAARKDAGKPDPLPHDIKPMMATLVDKAFDREGWLFEVKWDGYRAIAEIEDGKVRLYSRRNKTVNDKYAPVARALEKIKVNTVLDGEIVVLDERGHAQFNYLQNYLNTKRPLVYYVFDLLYLKDRNLMGLPLRERKALLRKLLPRPGIVRYSDDSAEGLGLFEAARKEGLEGIMAKDGASPYRPGERGADWLKVKLVQQQEAVIGGFTQPRKTRKLFGALVLGVYEGERLVYIGHAGGGFDQQELRRVYDMLQPLITAESPFGQPPHTNTPVTWVQPKLVCEVKFPQWTKDGIMRMPIYLGMRNDKTPREVTREQAKPTGEVVKQSTPTRSNGKSPGESEPRSLTLLPRRQPSKPAVVAGRLSKRTSAPPKEFDLTHPDKVLWPDDGFTKQDLFDYYRAVAPFILPYLRDRPESLHRFPNGIAAKGFFQKNIPEHPPWVQTVNIPSDAGDPVEYLVCQDEATLLYMANLACIELNPWNVRVQNLARPDWMVIDLDPLGVDFDSVVAVAKVVHRTFEQVDAASFCKTSGATGMHIFVPMGAKYETEQVVQFAELIANVVHQQTPELTSLERSPSARARRVYLDYLQNNRGQTLAAPYSVRPQPGATVSTPLKWSEVRAGLNPARFTIKTLSKRLDSVGDLWQAVLGKGINLEAALKRLRKLMLA